jgi:hypothetical protein
MVTSAGRRRGTRYWVGLVLVLTGVSALSWAGWQFYGTNLVAQGKHEQAVSDVRERWRAGAPVSERREGDVSAVLHRSGLWATTPWRHTASPTVNRSET